MTLPAMVRRLAEGLRARVQLMIGRAVVRAIDDGRRLQEVQLALLPGELRDQVERFQEYGFTSVPHPGAEAVVVFIGGNRDHGLVAACDDRRHRPRGLKIGEVMIYASFGQFMKMDEAGRLVISAPKGIRIESPEEIDIRGRVIRNHAEELFRFDAFGFGQQWAYDAGNQQWQRTDWVLEPDPTPPVQLLPTVSLQIDPPEAGQ